MAKSPPTRRKKSASPAPSPAGPRRSPCPVARSLDILGDRWTLLIVRDLFLGRTRFKDFAGSPEGIPTNILAERLERLQRHGIVRQVPARKGAKRMGYALTGKGKKLVPLLKAMRDWGLKWEKGTRVMSVAGWQR